MLGNGTGDPREEEVICSNNTPSIDGNFQVYLAQPWSLALLLMAFISTILNVVLYLYALMKIRQRNPFGSTRRRSLTLVFGLFPLFALTSLVGIIIPRAAYTVDWAASIYLALTVYSFLGLIMEYFGGAEAMLKFFQQSKVSYAQAPYACCCKCLPDVRMTERQFHLVRYLVLQVTIIRPLCVFIWAVLWSDVIQDNSVINNPKAVNFGLDTVAGFSTGFAVYGLQIFSKSSDCYLKQFYVKTKFVAVQLVLILTSLLSFTLDMLDLFDIIDNCQGPFSFPERALIIYNHVTIHIMAICILGFFLYWKWFGRFSTNKDDVNNLHVIPETPACENKSHEMEVEKV